MSMSEYDAIVIGGGHAGIEASLALSREGFETLLVTQSPDTIGRMSCNPSIGGLAKGNLVREIDALGGEMGKLIDASMIQMRILNRRRGPAVQAPRAQADKFSYSRLAKETVESEPHLHVFMDTVTDIFHENGRAAGIVTERGWKITARTVVLTTGTFMDGRIFIGEYDAPAGGKPGLRPGQRLLPPPLRGRTPHPLARLCSPVARRAEGAPDTHAGPPARNAWWKEVGSNPS